MQKKLLIFFLTHFTYGMIFSMFGPLIPYLAESTGKIQSEFTYIFILRGIAYLLAGFCQQSFFKSYCLYKRMLISCLTSGFCLFLLHIFYPYPLLASPICLVMFLANGSIEVLINVLLMSASAEDAKKAISFSYGFYGAGGVMGSVIVSMLGINALIFSAISLSVIGTLYFDLVTFKTTEKSALQEPINNTAATNVYSQKKTYLNNRIQKMFCILFCLYAAISLSYRSWVSSFIVMQNIASKQVAAISVSVYSGTLTIFRFIMMFWSPDIVKSLRLVTWSLIVSLVFVLLSYFLQIQFMLIYGTSIILGIIFSSYTPYLYALPSGFKLSFTQQGTCNTIIAYAIGQAVITALIGCMMQWFHPIMLFVMMFLFSIAHKYFMDITIYSLETVQKAIDNPQQIEMKELS